MKKTITVNGKKVKIDFSKSDYGLDSIERCNKTGKMKHALGKEVWTINGKNYTVEIHSNVNQKTGRINIQLKYNGLTFPDNEKRLIEHIIQNAKN